MFSNSREVPGLSLNASYKDEDNNLRRGTTSCLTTFGLDHRHGTCCKDTGNVDGEYVQQEAVDPSVRYSIPSSTAELNLVASSQSGSGKISWYPQRLEYSPEDGGLRPEGNLVTTVDYTVAGAGEIGCNSKSPLDQVRTWLQRPLDVEGAFARPYSTSAGVATQEYLNTTDTDWKSAVYHPGDGKHHQHQHHNYQQQQQHAQIFPAVHSHSCSSSSNDTCVSEEAGPEVNAGQPPGVLTSLDPLRDCQESRGRSSQPKAVVESLNRTAAPGKSTEAQPRSRGGGHIKKPLNAFMLFMKEMRAQVIAECTLKESAAINQILGRRWHALSREAQAKYYELARQEKELHQRLYPGWSARQNYAMHARRRGRITTASTETPGGQLLTDLERYSSDRSQRNRYLAGGNSTGWAAWNTVSYNQSKQSQLVPPDPVTNPYSHYTLTDKFMATSNTCLTNPTSYSIVDGHSSEASMTDKLVGLSNHFSLPHSQPRWLGINEYPVTTGAQDAMKNTVSPQHGLISEVHQCLFWPSAGCPSMSCASHSVGCDEKDGPDRLKHSLVSQRSLDTNANVYQPVLESAIDNPNLAFEGTFGHDPSATWIDRSSIPVSIGDEGGEPGPCWSWSTSASRTQATQSPHNPEGLPVMNYAHTMANHYATLPPPMVAHESYPAACEPQAVEGQHLVAQLHQLSNTLETRKDRRSDQCSKPRDTCPGFEMNSVIADLRLKNHYYAPNICITTANHDTNDSVACGQATTTMDSVPQTSFWSTYGQHEGDFANNPEATRLAGNSEPIQVGCSQQVPECIHLPDATISATDVRKTELQKSFHLWPTMPC